MIKNVLKNAVLATSLCGFGMCLNACSKVHPGERGVLVHQYGSDKGIEDKSVGIGWYFTAWGTSLYTFPTFLQNHTWDKEFTIQTKEGLSISAEVGITYQILPENVVTVFKQYREGLKEITDTFLRNMVRDAMNQVAATMGVQELYGEGKNNFLTQVNKLVKEEACQNGISVDKIYLIGSLKLPQTVIQSINSKIQASQNAERIHNEIAATEAEAQKRIIASKAEAQAISIVSNALSPEYVKYRALEKWDGKLPHATGGYVPFVDIGKMK